MTSDLLVRLGSCVLSVLRSNIVVLSLDEFDMMVQSPEFVGGTVLVGLPGYGGVGKH